MRLYRGEQTETTNGSESMLKEKFPGCKYIDVPGLCKVALLSEIEAQGWSLNPGRYIGVAEREADDFDFKVLQPKLMFPENTLEEGFT